VPVNSASASNPKSIVHIADYGGPYSGNFISSLQALKVAVQREGFRLVLVFSDIARNRPWLAEVEGNVSVHFMPKVASLPALVLRLLRILERENAAVLHTHFTTYDVAAWFAATIMRPYRKIGVIWHVHSDFPLKRSPARYLKDFLKLRFMARARNTHVVAVSDGVYNSLLNRGLTPQKVEVIPNGIDVARALKVSSSRGEMRLAFGIPENTFVILAFGWEPRTKGVDICLEACQALVREGLDIRLILVGGEQLEEFVRNWTPKSYPTWLHVVQPRECVGDFYSTADVFFAGSRWEGFPYSVGEAMACGLPVVTSNIPGLTWARSCPGVVSFDAGDTRGAIVALKKVISWPLGMCFEIPYAPTALTCGS